MTHSEPDYQSWHRASLRRGVVDQFDKPTPEFTAWKAILAGRCEIAPIKIEGLTGTVQLALFELEEDLAAYLLVCTEEYLRGRTAFDAAAFYALTYHSQALV